MSKKVSYSTIKKSFESEGYVLLSKTYKNNKSKLRYRCPKGHEHTITWNDWSSKGARCFYCFGTPKKKLCDLKKIFFKEGYVVLSREYNGKNHKLKCVCPNGHEYFTTWDNWNSGARCVFCSGLNKPSLNEVRRSFESEGYKLLSNEYINSMTKLEYICSEGHKGKVTWGDWNNSRARCFKCKYIKHSINQSGPLNHQWKGGKSFEPYCADWTKEYKEYIKERDGYRCLNPDCWKNDKVLSVHHIDYDKKNCNPNNLITVCRSCNSRANKNRRWHKAWYKTIIKNRYSSGGL